MWVPSFSQVDPDAADVDGNGVLSVDDVFLCAARWLAEPEGGGYRIFARAWDENMAFGEAFSPGEVIVPSETPAAARSLLRLVAGWAARN